MLRKIREMLKCQKGFTLVELMAVIAIIGVLAAIAIPRFTDTTNNASAAKIQSDLRNMESAAATVAASKGVNITAVTTDDVKTFFPNGTLPTAPWSGSYSITSSAISASTPTPAIAVGTPIYTLGTKNVVSTMTVADIRSALSK